MKIYGYENDGLHIENTKPLELVEVTLVATPDELRKIAMFITNAANEMEIRGNEYEHEHLSDKFNEFENSPHFVVFNPGAR